MPNKIKDLLELYKEEIDKLGREHLVKIILYGSYARGDFRQDSDIDIMILVNDLDDSLVEYENKVDDLTYDFNCKYGTEIMPIVKNIDLDINLSRSSRYDLLNQMSKAFLEKNLEDAEFAVLQFKEQEALADHIFKLL